MVHRLVRHIRLSSPRPTPAKASLLPRSLGFGVSGSSVILVLGCPRWPGTTSIRRTTSLTRASVQQRGPVDFAGQRSGRARRYGSRPPPVIRSRTSRTRAAATWASRRRLASRVARATSCSSLPSLGPSIHTPRCLGSPLAFDESHAPRSMTTEGVSHEAASQTRSMKASGQRLRMSAAMYRRRPWRPPERSSST
jgi:hypothetical protein